MAESALRSEYRAYYPDDEIPDDVFDRMVERYRYFDDIHRVYVTPPTSPDTKEES